MRIVAITVLALGITFPSLAQTGDSMLQKQHEFHNRQAGKNFEKLHLTDDQKAQIKTLNQSFRAQMQDLDKGATNSDDQLKEKRRALIKEHREKVEAILTPEQRKQAEEMKHELEPEGKGEMLGHRFEEMTKDLNLTPEQAAKMKDLNSAFRNNIMSLHQNTSLSHEEKKDQMKTLMKKHKADMESLLTDEQKQQLKNSRKNRQKEAVK